MNEYHFIITLQNKDTGMNVSYKEEVFLPENIESKFVSSAAWRICLGNVFRTIREKENMSLYKIELLEVI